MSARYREGPRSILANASCGSHLQSDVQVFVSLAWLTYLAISGGRKPVRFIGKLGCCENDGQLV